MKLETIRKVICALWGHSNIEESCFGYIHCARCKQQVGDTLAGAYKNERQVGMNCACHVCVANWPRLMWKDKLLTPKPEWVDDVSGYIARKQAKRQEFRKWMDSVKESRP